MGFGRRLQAMHPFFVNIAILIGCVLLAFGIEHSLHVHEYLHEFNDRHDADAYFLVTVTGLLGFLALSVYRQNREARLKGLAEQAARRLAHEDPLTGLPNRRALEQLLAKASPTDTHSIFMLDLNGFKPINDIFGHAEGDAVLKEVAARLKAIMRAQDFLCRIGGDEFAVFSKSAVTLEAAEHYAVELTRAFDQPFRITNGSDTQVGVAIGCHVSGLEPMPAIEGMRRADLALYRAKTEAGSAFVIFEQKLEQALRRRQKLEQKLRVAIKTGAVQPHFQPLVDLKTSQLLGFEALARWTDDELGYVPPNEFIAAAESIGLITELADVLMRNAFSVAATWPVNIHLSFNVSPLQFKDRLLGLRVMKLLGETGLQPRRLQLEITESALVADPAHAVAVLADLRVAGIKTALDDFGTGYSSLSQLKTFKFDNLKIDRAFVKGIGDSKEGLVILNAMLNLSRGLGLAATAEGIEDEVQLKCLLDMGCEHGQGFLFGKAVSADVAHALIYGEEAVAVSA